MCKRGRSGDKRQRRRDALTWRSLRRYLTHSPALRVAAQAGPLAVQASRSTTRSIYTEGMAYSTYYPTTVSGPRYEQDPAAGASASRPERRSRRRQAASPPRRQFAVPPRQVADLRCASQRMFVPAPLDARAAPAPYVLCVRAVPERTTCRTEAAARCFCRRRPLLGEPRDSPRCPRRPRPPRPPSGRPCSPSPWYRHMARRARPLPPLPIGRWWSAVRVRRPEAPTPPPARSQPGRCVASRRLRLAPAAALAGVSATRLGDGPVPF